MTVIVALSIFLLYGMLSLTFRLVNGKACISVFMFIFLNRIMTQSVSERTKFVSGGSRICTLIQYVAPGF